MYSSNLYAETVLEIVHEESVKVYHLHIHVQREYSAEPSSRCVESCVTKESPISPRFSPTFFHRDAISLLLRAYLCTVVDSMRRKPCVRKCSSREREALYNGNECCVQPIQQCSTYEVVCTTYTVYSVQEYIRLSPS